MKKIEITTAQKVIIQYELAGLKDRILAFFIDSIVLWTAIALCAGLITGISDSALLNYEATDVLIYFIVVPVFIFYTLVSELITNGQTLGKKAMGLKVVKLRGGLPTADDFVLRWMFRAVDIYATIGAVAALLISSSDKAQRLGGLLSNTAVVKLKGNLMVRLDNLEKMFEKADDYKPTYPEVTVFEDQEMLAIKELIQRFKKYPNASHASLIRQTCKNVTYKLGLGAEPKNKIQFLQLVIKDYVMLTR